MNLQICMIMFISVIKTKGGMSSKQNETLDLIHQLQSIREYETKEIAQGDLESILQAAVRAANASARQSYSIIVVREREHLKKYFYGADKALIICVDYNRLIKCAEHLAHPYDYYNLLGFITGSTDAILLAQTAVIAAKSLGIDSLFTNSLHRASFDEIQKEFNLPKKHCFPLISICLGYRKSDPEFKKGRLSGPGVIHYDHYHELTSSETENLIAEFDDPIKHLGLNYDHEFPHYLDWFFLKWSQNRYGDEKGKNMTKLLQDLGFIPE